jgi:hypothetical protein
MYGYEIALACIKTNLRLENTTFKKKMLSWGQRSITSWYMAKYLNMAF